MSVNYAKRDYNKARHRALISLAHMHPETYQQLLEAELGRSLKKQGRPLTERVANGELTWGEKHGR